MIQVDPAHRINQIVEKLSPSLTGNEKQALKRDSLTRFFRSLVETYESKVERYLKNSSYEVKLKLKDKISSDLIDAVTTEKVIQYAYAILLEQNKMSFLPALIHLLRKQEPQLLASLGLSSTFKIGNTTHKLDQIAIRVFKSYMARHRLFQELGAEETISLCKEVNRETSPFPEDLAGAFAVHQAFEMAFRQLSTVEPVQPGPQIVARIIKGNQRAIDASLQSILSFISNIINSAKIDPEIRKQFYCHLDNPNDLISFSKAISYEFIRVSSEETHLALQQANKTILESAETNSCSQALRFLGVQIVTSRVDIEKAKEKLNQEMKSIDDWHKECQKTLDGATQRQISEAHSKIDEGLKNFKPVWQVQVGYTGHF